MSIQSWLLKSFSSKMYLLPVTLSFFISLSAVSDLYAFDCNSPSPIYTEGKNHDDKIIVRDLTRSEQKMITKLFKSWSGHWKGEAEDMECRGPKDAPYQVHNKYSISAKVKTDRYGNMRIETGLYSKAKRTSHSEAVDFYLHDNKFRFNTESWTGDVELIDITESQIKFLKKMKLSGGYGQPGGIPRDIFTTLSAGANAFTVETLIYSQGRLFNRLLRQYKR